MKVSAPRPSIRPARTSYPIVRVASATRLAVFARSSNGGVEAWCIRPGRIPASSSPKPLTMVLTSSDHTLTASSAAMNRASPTLRTGSPSMPNTPADSRSRSQVAPSSSTPIETSVGYGAMASQGSNLASQLSDHTSAPTPLTQGAGASWVDSLSRRSRRSSSIRAAATSGSRASSADSRRDRSRSARSRKAARSVAVAPASRITRSVGTSRLGVRAIVRPARRRRVCARRRSMSRVKALAASRLPPPVRR